VDLFEHQAKELFAQYGVPVPTGKVATTPAEARTIADELTGRVVVKAQVKAGGRGKAGGVKVAADSGDAQAKAEDILGMDIKGLTVHKVLVEQASDIAEEFYASFLLDRSNRTFLAMCSSEGGMEIEEVAATKPEMLARVPVDPLKGVDRAMARSIAEQGHLPEAALDGAAELLEKLWQVFVREDATLVEVNPLILTGRHHRQRCRAGDVDARRRHLRRRGVRRDEAGQLPRHRRRGLRAGDGRRPVDHPR